MTKKLKKNLVKIIAGGVVFLLLKCADTLLAHFLPDRFPDGLASVTGTNAGWILPLALYLAVYLFVGFSVLRKAGGNILRGQVLDENFLMAVATIGAFGLGIYTAVKTGAPEGFDEACAVMLFYQLGEWFQAYAVGRSRRSIAELMDIRPEYAVRVLDNDTTERTDPASVSVGEIIRVLPGERIPLDGTVIRGETALDVRALTGESAPVQASPGSYVLSGSVNMQTVIDILVGKVYAESTVSKILELVENASNQKSRSEQFITKFARYYTPAVVFSALALVLIPTLISGLAGDWSVFDKWLYRGLSFLVVSCPCALVISIPLSFFAGIGGAARNSVLVKGSIYLEWLSKARTFVFDKTGTLTCGNFEVVKVVPEENRERILGLAAQAECQSNHPIAGSILRAYGKEVTAGEYSLENISGKGVEARGGHTILCGNEKLMQDRQIDYVPNDEPGTVVYIACDGIFEGSVVIADEMRPDAAATVSSLNGMGCRTVMLTGDNEKIAGRVAQLSGVTDYKASLLPQDKVSEADKLLRAKKQGEYLCFVGDGINDAPVLMQADIGIAMGGIGSDAAIEASDVVLMKDRLSDILTSVRLARRTMRIVYENIWFSIGVKVLILVLSALGLANMWLAVFGDVGVAFIAILNAMRANRKFTD